MLVDEVHSDAERSISPTSNGRVRRRVKPKRSFAKRLRSLFSRNDISAISPERTVVNRPRWFFIQRDLYFDHIPHIFPISLSEAQFTRIVEKRLIEREFIRPEPVFTMPFHTSSAYLSSCEMFSFRDRNWNAEFQDILDSSDLLFEDAKRRYNRLIILLRTFIKKASKIVRILVERDDKDGSVGTIIGTHHRCCRVGNIFFCLWYDAKLAANYVKSLQIVLSTRTRGLTVPLTVLILYCGIPVTAQAVIPLPSSKPISPNHSSESKTSINLFPGHVCSSVIGSGRCADEETSQMLSKMYCSLGLSDCIDEGKGTLCSSPAVDVYVALDGRRYITSSHVTQVPLFADSRIALKRSEFLLRSNPDALEPGCSSVWRAVLYNSQPFLLEQLRRVREIKAACSEAELDVEIKAQARFVQVLHHSGLNMCLLRKAYEFAISLPFDSALCTALRERLAVEMISRTLVSLFIRESSAKMLAFDSEEIGKMLTRTLGLLLLNPIERGLLVPLARKFGIDNTNVRNDYLVRDILLVKSKHIRFIEAYVYAAVGARRPPGSTFFTFDPVSRCSVVPPEADPTYIVQMYSPQSLRAFCNASQCSCVQSQAEAFHLPLLAQIELWNREGTDSFDKIAQLSGKSLRDCTTNLEAKYAIGNALVAKPLFLELLEKNKDENALYLYESHLSFAHWLLWRVNSTEESDKDSLREALEVLNNCKKIFWRSAISKLEHEGERLLHRPVLMLILWQLEENAKGGAHRVRDFFVNSRFGGGIEETITQFSLGGCIAVEDFEHARSPLRKPSDLINLEDMRRWVMPIAVRTCCSIVAMRVVRNLAYALAREGNFDNSIEVLEEALTAIENRSGPSCPEVAILLTDIVFLRVVQGEDISGIVELIDRSTVVAADCFGQDSREYAIALNNKGVILAAAKAANTAVCMESLVEALRAFGRARAVCREGRDQERNEDDSDFTICIANAKNYADKNSISQKAIDDALGDDESAYGLLSEDSICAPPLINGSLGALVPNSEENYKAESSRAQLPDSEENSAAHLDTAESDKRREEVKKVGHRVSKHNENASESFEGEDLCANTCSFILPDEAAILATHFPFIDLPASEFSNLPAFILYDFYFRALAAERRLLLERIPKNQFQIDRVERQMADRVAQLQREAEKAKCANECRLRALREKFPFLSPDGCLKHLNPSEVPLLIYAAAAHNIEDEHANGESEEAKIKSAAALCLTQRLARQNEIKDELFHSYPFLKPLSDMGFDLCRLILEEDAVFADLTGAYDQLRQKQTITGQYPQTSHTELFRLEQRIVRRVLALALRQSRADQRALARTKDVNNDLPFFSPCPGGFLLGNLRLLDNSEFYKLNEGRNDALTRGDNNTVKESEAAMVQICNQIARSRAADEISVVQLFPLLLYEPLPGPFLALLGLEDDAELLRLRHQVDAGAPSDAFLSHARTVAARGASTSVAFDRRCDAVEAFFPFLPAEICGIPLCALGLFLDSEFMQLREERYNLLLQPRLNSRQIAEVEQRMYEVALKLARMRREQLSVLHAPSSPSVPCVTFALGPSYDKDGVLNSQAAEREGGATSARRETARHALLRALEQHNDTAVKELRAEGGSCSAASTFPFLPALETTGAPVCCEERLYLDRKFLNLLAAREARVDDLLDAVENSSDVPGVDHDLLMKLEYQVLCTEDEMGMRACEIVEQGSQSGSAHSASANLPSPTSEFGDGNKGKEEDRRHQGKNRSRGQLTLDKLLKKYPFLLDAPSVTTGRLAEAKACTDEQLLQLACEYDASKGNASKNSIEGRMKNRASELCGAGTGKQEDGEDESLEADGSSFDSKSARVQKEQVSGAKTEGKNFRVSPLIQSVSSRETGETSVLEGSAAQRVGAKSRPRSAYRTLQLDESKERNFIISLEREDLSLLFAAQRSIKQLLSSFCKGQWQEREMLQGGIIELQDEEERDRQAIQADFFTYFVSLSDTYTEMIATGRLSPLRGLGSATRRRDSINSKRSHRSIPRL